MKRIKSSRFAEFCITLKQGVAIMTNTIISLVCGLAVIGALFFCLLYLVFIGPEIPGKENSFIWDGTTVVAITNEFKNLYIWGTIAVMMIGILNWKWRQRLIKNSDEFENFCSTMMKKAYPDD